MGGVAARFGSGGFTLGKFAWLPQGEYMYFEGTTEGVRNLWRVPIDRRTLAWAAREARQRCIEEMAANVEDFLRGGRRGRVV